MMTDDTTSGDPDDDTVFGPSTLLGRGHALAPIGKIATAVSIVTLCALAYLPALLSSPGRMPADSKLYVYLDPGRFLEDAASSFDPRLYAGWVPHQHIAYLWPTGPWFWALERIGAPDWVAHRLWIGTLLVAGGLGARWLARMLGVGAAGALVAAVVYQLSPYVLPYISRTSVLLLPWAGLGWIVGLTVLATRRGGWRYPAAIALVVFTVGAVNATALIMVIPAPLVWLVHTVWRGDTEWKRAVDVAGRVAVLSILVSLWWAAMLVIQSRRGADVLAYSESLDSVSFTSTSTEVVRGLGYWLFYVRDAFGATTTMSIDHLVSLRTILAGLLVLAIGLAGIVVVRWPHRRFAGLLVGVGTVVAVGVHPIDDPSPLMSALVGDEEAGLALALRSSTRAVPVLVLGVALGAGALVEGVRTRTRQRSHGSRARREVPHLVLAASICALAVLNLPALRGRLVDPGLEREQDPPDAWVDAARRLDALADGYRVLQVPGAEFGAFQWGYTVDQPLASLTERPVLTRDLLPLGSAAAMDLVFALDDRFQDETLEVDSVAPVARLLGVDTLWLAGDLQDDRFRTVRPEVAARWLTGDEALAADLLDAVEFGSAQVMPSQVPMIDEEFLATSVATAPIPPVVLVGVADAVSTVRVKTLEVLVSGSADGIVDAAAAGLIDGTELIRYTASFDDGGLDDVIGSGPAADVPLLIVTDSNRDRAHHWRSSQDVHGATEVGGPSEDVLRPEPADERLPVFDRADPSTQTIAVQRGQVRAGATAYGEPFAYRPEDRPVMAIDGDPSTAWLVADRAPARGEFIRLAVDAPIDHLTLLQPPSTSGERSITQVGVVLDDRAPVFVDLGEGSHVAPGQRIGLGPTAGPSEITITITETSDPQPPIGEAIGAVGFSEIGVGLDPTVEVVRPPHDALSRIRAGSDVAIVLTRLRADPQDRFRSDPEPFLRRAFDLPVAVPVEADVTVRLDHRADGDVLASILGERAWASGSLLGSPQARGAAAFDDDFTTSWVSPFGEPVGHSLRVEHEGTARTVSVTQPEGEFSPITRMALTDPAGTIEVELPPDPGASVPLPRPLDLEAVTITVLATDDEMTIDRRYGEPIVLPSAIAEVRFGGSSPRVRPVERIVATCRADILTVDERPLAVTFDASVSDALEGKAIAASPCDPSGLDLAAGAHEVAGAPASMTGIDVDRVVLRSLGVDVPAADTASDTASDTVSDTASGAGSETAPTVVSDVERRDSSRRRTVDVPACPDGCWLVLGEGFNEAWSAESSLVGDLGTPELVDGNANGWWLAPSIEPQEVVLTWTAQWPLTVALIASLAGVILAAAIVVFAGRKPTRWARPAVTLTSPLAHRSPRERRGAFVSLDVVTILVPALAAGVLIGWTWMIPAAVLGAVGAVLARPRVVAVAGWLIVVVSQLTVAVIVSDERPYPDAGWPARFEWLHGWTLLGVVLLTSSLLVGGGRRPSEAEPMP